MGTSKVAKKRILPAWMLEKMAVPAQKLAEGRTKQRKKVWTSTDSENDKFPSFLNTDLMYTCEHLTMENMLRSISRTETVYCMNEAELVDAALCILAEKCKDREMESASSEDETQEPLQVVADPLWNSVSRCGSKGSRSPATGPKAPNKLEPSACSEETKSEKDDDALKYVREIFFS